MGRAWRCRVLGPGHGCRIPHQGEGTEAVHTGHLPGQPVPALLLSYLETVFTPAHASKSRLPWTALAYECGWLYMSAEHTLAADQAFQLSTLAAAHMPEPV